jgi:hypothetical protein
MLLLTAAGSSMKGFAQLIHQPLGYDPHNVMAVGIPLRENSFGTWEARAAYFEQLRQKVAATSGVTAAAISTDATPPRNGWIMGVEILGHPVISPPMASINLIAHNILRPWVFPCFKDEFGRTRRIPKVPTWQ